MIMVFSNCDETIVVLLRQFINLSHFIQILIKIPSTVLKLNINYITTTQHLFYLFAFGNNKTFFTYLTAL